jgi:ribosomal silencing factor RsfS
MSEGLKRISMMIREDQYEALNERGLNLSGLVRDLIDDYLSSDKITLSVSDDTRKLYDAIVANTGSNDAEIEAHLKEALKVLLKAKIKAMQELERKAFGSKA